MTHIAPQHRRNFHLADHARFLIPSSPPPPVSSRFGSPSSASTRSNNWLAVHILFPILAAVSLVSCTTGPFYQQGPPDLSKSGMFLPKNKTKNTILTQTLFELGKIDGLDCGRPVRFPNGERGIAVTPGNHLIGVGVVHGAPGGTLITAQGTIPMKVQAGKIYEVMGSFAECERMDFWIREYSTQNRASKTITVDAKNKGVPKPTFIFIGS